METFVQDLRHACRLLARRPGFTAVAVLSLAVGIGGNATIFGLVDGFVLHPFPYPEAGRIVGIGVTFPKMSDEDRFVEALSPAEFLDIRESRTIQAIAAFDLGNRNISGGDRPERVFTGLALTDPFGPFKLRPALGRGFTREELAPRGPRVAIISYRLWQSRFGGEPSLVGRAVRVNGNPTTVVGVMPRELLILGTDLWIPWGADPREVPRNMRQFTLIGRLAPGATLDAANAELATIAGRLAGAFAGTYKEYEGWRLSATPWATAMMRDARPAAFMLLGAVALVLLIACANLSNLLLARATSRQREMAIRLALGAGRSRIARHVLTEIAVVAGLGAAAGLLLAHAGLRAAIHVVPTELESLGLTASVNTRVLAWATASTIGAALLVALLPVFQSSRTDPHDALKADGRGTTGSRGQRRMRHALIIAEVALSVMLVCGAGLLVRSFVKLRQVEPGLDLHNVLTMRVTVPPDKYRAADANEFFRQVNAFFQQVIDRVEQIPGVRAVSVASQFPPMSAASTELRVEGIESGGSTMPTALITAVSEEHFGTLRVPTVAGRSFSDRDRAGTQRVVMVNQAFAARFLSGATPIGHRLRTGSDNSPSPPFEIVGVVANTRNRGLAVPPAPEIFVPMHQQTLNNQLFLLVRTDSDAAAMLPAVRAQIATLDPDQPVYAVQTMEDAFSAAAFQQRLSMILLAVFAAVAVSLAAVGIYGVMSYAVSSRTQEIGVRIAVGAARLDVMWLVLGQVLRLTAAGLAIGIAASLAVGGAMRRLLFEVRPSDPVTLTAVTIVLGSVALVAGWLPAWRASRVDPVDALRYE
jgi:putative ABC transport system permease protein